MRYTQHLNETFDKPAPFKWLPIRDAETREARFTIAGMEYFVRFVEHDDFQK